MSELPVMNKRIRSQDMTLPMTVTSRITSQYQCANYMFVKKSNYHQCYDKDIFNMHSDSCFFPTNTQSTLIFIKMDNLYL